MADPTSNATQENNELENQPIGESALPHAPTDNSPVIGAPDRASPLTGVLERRWRRNNNRNELNGLIRDHNRLITAAHNGRLSLEKAEVLSRMYGRHREMVTAAKQMEHYAAIRQRLEEISAERLGDAVPLLGELPVFGKPA